MDEGFEPIMIIVAVSQPKNLKNKIKKIKIKKKYNFLELE